MTLGDALFRARGRLRFAERELERHRALMRTDDPAHERSRRKLEADVELAESDIAHIEAPLARSADARMAQ
jgi:hypothetical protein